MFIGYLYAFIFFPVLVGMLSVDAEGNEFDSIAYILDRIPVFLDTEEEDAEETKQLEEQIEDDITNPQMLGLPPEVNEGIGKVWKYLWFVGSQSKDLGVWIATSTAPFHYGVAFLIALFALFWYPIMTVIAFFYLLVTEFDEFRNLRRKDII